MANPFNAFNDNRPLVIGSVMNNAKLFTAGQGVLAAGSVLGVVTATGALSLCAAASVDGSEVARYVLTKEVDTDTVGAVAQDVLKAGIVNAELLVFGGADVVDTPNAVTGLTHRENLAANGILAISGTDLEAQDNT